MGSDHTLDLTFIGCRVISLFVAEEKRKVGNLVIYDIMIG